MLDKGSALSRPRGPSTCSNNIAPIRKAPIKINNKENMINPGNQWNDLPFKNNGIYPENETYIQQNLIKKPLISPVRSQFKNQIDNLYEQ